MSSLSLRSSSFSSRLSDEYHLPLLDADVVVLNTCCIRENADNKLYGALGNLKVDKEANPDLQIVVGGCLAQKDRDLIRERAPHVDVVLGTHNVHRVADLLEASTVSGT